MSSVARFSYTAPITLWRVTGIDDWTGQKTFSAPVFIWGDYSVKSEKRVDRNGNDFISVQNIYTELSTENGSYLPVAKPNDGDFILVNVHSSEVSPVNAGAMEIRSVLDYGDTLERSAPDYLIIT